MTDEERREFRKMVFEACRNAGLPIVPYTPTADRLFGERDKEGLHDGGLEN